MLLVTAAPIFIADVMSRNRFQLLLENLCSVNNDEIDKNDKHAKVRPIVDC